MLFRFVVHVVLRFRSGEVQKENVNEGNHGWRKAQTRDIRRGLIGWYAYLVDDAQVHGIGSPGSFLYQIQGGMQYEVILSRHGIGAGSRGHGRCRRRCTR